MQLRSSTVAQRPLPPQEPFQFLSLPAEIRERVYKIVLIYATPCHTSREYAMLLSSCKPDSQANLIQPRRRYHANPSRIALALTCRQAYAEAIQIYYRHNLIQIPYPLLPNFVSDVNATEYRAITRLCLSRPSRTRYYHDLRPYAMLLAHIDPIALFQNLRHLQVSGQAHLFADLHSNPYHGWSVDPPSKSLLRSVAALEKLEVIEWISFQPARDLSGWSGMGRDWTANWPPWRYYRTPYRLTHLAAEGWATGLMGPHDGPVDWRLLGDGNVVEYLEK